MVKYGKMQDLANFKQEFQVKHTSTPANFVRKTNKKIEDQRLAMAFANIALHRA